MTDSHDPWEAARERQREDVQAIFAKRAAAPVTDRRREFRLSRRNSAIVLAVIAAIGLVALLVVPAMRDDAAHERAAAAARAEAPRGRRSAPGSPRSRRRTSRAGPRRRAGEDPLAYRARLVTAGAAPSRPTRKHADEAGHGRRPGGRHRVRSRIPPRRRGRAQEADPAIPANRYECIAYERKFPLSELEGKARTGIIGVPYWLVVDYAHGELSLLPHRAARRRGRQGARRSCACSRSAATRCYAASRARVALESAGGGTSRTFEPRQPTVFHIDSSLAGQTSQMITPMKLSSSPAARPGRSP